MKRVILKRTSFSVMAFAVVVWSLAMFSNATSTIAQQMPNGGPQMQRGQNGPPDDPIRQLDLTPDQIAKIRAIREGAKDERMATNQRLRQAQLALDDAIETENASETLIEQRARELAEAQVAATRMRAITELRIRRVMTPEQLAKLRTLRQQAQQFREDRRNPVPREIRREDRQQRRRDALQPGNPRPYQAPPGQPGPTPMKPRP
jgi:Spy/CpxP family protein refolding chaperone